MPTKTKIMPKPGDKNQIQFVVNLEASKKACIKRSAIFEETKLKNWPKKYEEYIKSQRKNCPFWKEPEPLQAPPRIMVLMVYNFMVCGGVKNNILYVILRSYGKWFVPILLSCKFSRGLRGDFVVQICSSDLFDYP